MTELLLYLENLISLARHMSPSMELFQTLGAMLFTADLPKVTGPKADVTIFFNELLVS